MEKLSLRKMRCATRCTSSLDTACSFTTTSSIGSISPIMSSCSPARCASAIVDSIPSRKVPMEYSRALVSSSSPTGSSTSFISSALITVVVSATFSGLTPAPMERTPVSL